MTKQHFSFQEVFKFGWAKTKQHAWFIVLTFIIAGVCMSAVKLNPVLDMIVSMMVGLSIVSISLLIARDHHFTFHDLYTPLLSPKKVLKFAALSVLYVVAVGIGTILFIVPGIYVATRFQFFPFVVAENENTHIKDLITMSYKLSHNHFWVILAFLVLSALLNIAGALFFLIGLIITVPITVFANAYMYIRLKEHSV